MQTSPYAAFIAHIDECCMCLAGSFCEQARRLAYRGAELAAQLIAPIPEIKKSPIKA